MLERAQDIVRLWEKGQGLSPLGRTMLLLRAERSDLDVASAALLSLGARDQALLNLRERLFGPTLQMFAPCASCHAELEVELTTAQVRAACAQADAIFEEVFDSLRVRYRLPCSADLHALSGPRDLQPTYLELLSRCVLAITPESDAPISPELTASTAEAIAARMLEHDPQAEILLHVSCLECGHGWQTALDLGSYLWTELSTAAKRLMLEVHALAHAYGWREPDVLELGPQRRQFYLSLVGARP